MQEEEGVEALEAFEYHQNSELSSMAVSLIEKYFYTEEVCVSPAAHVVASSPCNNL